MPQLTIVKLSQISDEEIVSLYLSSQDEYYFSEIYQRYSGKIFGKCLSFFKDESEAADAVHDIFMKLLLNMSKFGEKSKFSTWVYSITYNYCIDTLRRGKKLQVTSIEEISGELDVEEDTDESWMDLIDMNIIEDIMNKMHPQDKAVLLMKYIDDLSIKEICAILNKTESAIKMKIKRAKERFREQLKNTKYE
ncbi:MAG TPA: sigma-70 family RNA polymerase sigma factor [Saprospiraceae bacterium]|nr:sigma-70 family RNA polymerase sigma factor [Saprospiraceae bacterium]HMS28531.1 sigma-70 family RNA polymerase sigma factor [Saprospiraceae bacterium]